MPARAAARSQNVQFLRVSRRRSLEPHLEAGIIGITRRWRSDAAEACLPFVLASLCRFAFITWTRLPHLDGLPTARDRCVFDFDLSSAGFPGNQAAWVWTLFSR